MIQKKPAETTCFHFHNENPKDRRTTDCVVRAIAAATDQTWNEVLDGLCVVAKKYSVMIDDKACYGRYLKSLGWVMQKQPRKNNNTKYTGKEFCEQWQRDARVLTDKEDIDTKNVVAHIGNGHVVCIKDGVIYDTWNSSGGCIGNFFIKE